MKCPGGKWKLTTKLSQHLPEDFFNKNYNYLEPFVGGGAFLLYLLNKEPKLARRAFINDKNAHIYNLWKAVQCRPQGVINSYTDLVKEHLSQKENYYNIRENLVGLYSMNIDFSDSDEAAKFLYLNKNCFNGALRFNKKGNFNAPVGLYSKKQLFNGPLITEVSKAIENVKISCLDFQEFIESFNSSARKWGDLFLYFDPPYAPLSSTSHFTYYTAGGFLTYDQYRLKNLMDFLTFAGSKVMITNSHAPLIRELYKDYNIHELEAKRSINCKGSKRGEIKELIITNY
jgi:DNA adenine methylase